MASVVFDLMASLGMDSSKFDSGMVEAQKKINRFSKGMGAIGSGLTSFGSTLTNKVTKPALVAGGALAGITLAKGWMRMTEIDTAKVKLEAIGLSAKEVGDVTDASLASVKGTAYGMAEAMTTAASATAAGIDPATELQQYLTDVADAAAVAGIGMDEMGSIFNKVATQGKASNEILQQMAERGIPIYQWLADETHHTADEIFDMASRGEIDLATFQAAVENHIGGAAKEIGSKTISGAISNINAAIGRLGAAFLGSADDSSTFAGKILPMLNDMTAWIDNLTPKVEAVGQVFGQVFGAIYDYLKTGSVEWQGMGDSAKAVFEKLKPGIDIIKNIVTWFSELSTKGKVAFVGITVGIGPALTIIGKLFTSFSNLSGIIGKLPASVTKFLGPIGLAVSAFIVLWTKSEEFRKAVINLVSSLISALAPAFQSIAPLLSSVGSLISNVAEVIGPVLGVAIQAVTPLIVLLGKAFSKIVTPIVGAITKIVSAVNKLIAKAKSMAEPFNAAKDTIKKAINKIKGLFPLKIGKIFSGIKLPTFDVKGGSPPYGLFGKGKKPSISVKWHAKAANQPYLFTDPTVFGYGAGETVDEVLYGKKSLMQDISNAVEGVNSSGNVQITNYITVSGAENPEDFAERFARKLKLDMRTA